jgi:hypothetical protein
MLISLSSENVDDGWNVKRISFTPQAVSDRRKLMQKFIKKNWFHIVAWTVILVYFAVAPDLYVLFFLKNGKPLQIDGNLPTETDQIKFRIDNLEEVKYEGQNIYRLYGWAFSTMYKEVPPDMYEREIVLTSNSNTYFFPIENLKRPGVQDVYKYLQMDLVDSGFLTLISKDVILPGEYRVGIVFKNLLNNSAYYADKPKRTVIRTPNNLFLK